MMMQHFEIKGRMETGVAQFGEQPPGFFLRGKDAIAVAQLLDQADGPHSSDMKDWARRLRSAWIGEAPVVLHLATGQG